MGFQFWKVDIVSVSFNQSYVNSKLKLFWSLDLVLQFAWILWCELNKSSIWKTITLKLKIGDSVREKEVSYEQAHEYATKFLTQLSKDDEDFQQSLSTLST